jgi:para-nitrobenzyl esterase
MASKPACRSSSAVPATMAAWSRASASRLTTWSDDCAQPDCPSIFFIRDVIFTMQARWAADRHAPLAPTWRYYFDYTAVGLTLPAFKGASHGGDVVFTLDSHVALGSEAQFTAADRAVARQIGDYWFAFAKTGQPAAANAPLWPDHRSDRDSTMVFTATPSVERDFMRARLNTMMASTRLLERLMAR